MPKHDNLWLTTKWCDLEERERGFSKKKKKKKIIKQKLWQTKKSLTNQRDS